MINLYSKYVLPRITNAVCSSSPNMKQREKVVPNAYGRVLEIGAGSGLNFRYYDPDKVEHLFALDPSEEMWSIAKSQTNSKLFDIDFIKGYAEQIPMDDDTVDSILITYTLCTIPDVSVSLEEMRRVLKPGGVFIFCEHGIAPDKSVQKWQNLLNPMWKKLGGGCNLNRDIPNLINTGPFEIQKLNTMYLPGFKPASFNFWGVAKPKP